MNFAVTKDDFYNNGMHTDFISTMAAFLNLSTDRVKIVGVRTVTTRILEGRRILSNSIAVDSVIDDDS